MVVLFVGVESTFGYFEATREYIERYGKPMAFYSDKASVFRVNKQSAAAGKGHTQFGRALYELNIDGMCANTPAAKGRVERAHQTLQDRLVKELRLQRISTVDGANEFMPTFIDDYNRRFGKLARDRHDAHRAVRKDEDLDAIFAWREYRKVTDSLTLRYERKMYCSKIRRTTDDTSASTSKSFSFPTVALRSAWQGSHCPTRLTTKSERLTTVRLWTTSG
jgi:hypothetical protein